MSKRKIFASNITKGKFPHTQKVPPKKQIRKTNNLIKKWVHRKVYKCNLIKKCKPELHGSAIFFLEWPRSKSLITGSGENGVRPYCPAGGNAGPSSLGSTGQQEHLVHVLCYSCSALEIHCAGVVLHSWNAT